MSVMRAWCCGGRGGAAGGHVDRGVSLRRVVVALGPGRRDSVPCRRRAGLVSGCIDLLSWLFVMMCGVLKFVGEGH